MGKQQNQAATKENCHVKDASSRSRRILKKKYLRSFAKYCPLISATLAPFSTLMDIPALSVCVFFITKLTLGDLFA